MKLLVSHGADLGLVEENYGKTAEKIAEEMAHVKILDFLRNKNK